MTVTEALELFELADAPSDEVVKRAYRNVARIIHPDRHAGSETATRLLKRHTVARDTLLRVPQRRRVRRGNSAGPRPRPPGGDNRRFDDAADFRAQFEHVAAFSTWLTRELPRGRTAQVLVAGTALLAFGTLAFKVLEDSRTASSYD